MSDMANEKRASCRVGKPVKLAEALLLRGDIKKTLASLRERLVLNGRVQEGDKPHEDPEELLREAAAVLKQQETLVVQVDQANARTKLADGRTLLEARCQRDSLVAQHAMIAVLLQQTSMATGRYSSSEIKWKITYNVKGYQKRLEELARRIRQINAQIQETNWTVNL